MLNEVQKHILEVIADLKDTGKGAMNIRSDGKKLLRRNTETIRIESKTDKDGIDIHIAPFTKNESVHIPVVLTENGYMTHLYDLSNTVAEQAIAQKAQAMAQGIVDYFLAINQ